MLVAYFDESGTSDADDIALFGGVVAKTMEWASLERPWRKKLNEFGVKTYHAVDCEWGHKEFEHLQRPIREAVTDYLAGRLGGMVALGFGSGVIRKDWKHAPDYLRAQCMDDPLVFSLGLCFQHVSTWAEANVGNEPIAFVFACHQKYGKIVEQVHGLYRSSRHWKNIGSVSFAKPQCLIPLQAADLLTYELLRYARDGAKPDFSRTALNSINRRVEEGSSFQVSYKLHDAETLPQLKPFASLEEIFEQPS